MHPPFSSGRGFNPAISTITKMSARKGAIFVCGDGATASRDGVERRSLIESADEMASRGRGNFRVATRKLSVTYPAISTITPAQLCKELGGLRFVGDGGGERRRRSTTPHSYATLSPSRGREHLGFWRLSCQKT